MKKLPEISNEDEDVDFIYPQYGRKIRQIILEEDIFYRFNTDKATYLYLYELKNDINKIIINSYNYIRHMYETIEGVSSYPKGETINDWFSIISLYFYECLYTRTHDHFIFDDEEIPTPAEVEKALAKLYLLEKEISIRNKYKPYYEEEEVAVMSPGGRSQHLRRCHIRNKTERLSGRK